MWMMQYAMKNQLGGNSMKDCENCNKPDHEKPMAFRGERWCSEACRKKIEKDTPQKRW